MTTPKQERLSNEEFAKLARGTLDDHRAWVLYTECRRAREEVEEWKEKAFNLATEHDLRVHEKCKLEKELVKQARLYSGIEPDSSVLRRRVEQLENTLRNVRQALTDRALSGDLQVDIDHALRSPKKTENIE